MASGRIRVGVGGWVYEPWRETFYPEGLPKAQELEYLSRRVTAIEINATYYRTQTPASFAKWRDATPEDFVFSVKANRFATRAGESIERFVGSGLAELGPKLGPLVWQFATSKAFDAEDFSAFLTLLPATIGTTRLRHAIEVRHPSFRCAEYLALARRFGVASVFADSDEYPSFADTTADFVYARLMKGESTIASGYAPDRIAAWAERGRRWASGGDPEGVPRVEAPRAPDGIGRDVFLFFISGAKERNPAAAVATLAALG